MRRGVPLLLLMILAACRPEVGDAELRALVECCEAWPGPGV